jgi:hypothetical protein
MIVCIIVEQKKYFDTVAARYKHEEYLSAIYSAEIVK